MSRAKGVRVADWLVTRKVDVVLAKESLGGKGPKHASRGAGLRMRETEAEALNEIPSEVREGG